MAKKKRPEESQWETINWPKGKTVIHMIEGWFPAQFLTNQ